MSPTLKKRLWLTVKISCFSGVLSGIFSLITAGFTLQSLIFFVCVGFFCAFLGFGVETLWLSRIFRRTPVWTQILLKTLTGPAFIGDAHHDMHDHDHVSIHESGCDYFVSSG